MKKENILKDEKKSIAKVLVVSMTNEDKKYAVEVSKELRKEDINTEIFLEDKKVKTKFKYADKLCIPYVAVIGEEERKNKQITLKNMQTGEQETLDLKQSVEKIKKG